MKRFLKGLLLIIASVFILAAYPAPAFLQENAEAEKPVVYIGLIPLYTPSLMYERFQPLMDYLSDNTPFRFKMRLTKDYKGIVTLLEDDSIDIALLGGASYIIAKSKAEVVPLVKPLNQQGKPFYKSVIITREDKDIKGISDLKGRSFAFASRWSTSGAVVPLYHLYTHGIGLQGLPNYFHLRYHDSVAREVLKGNYDAGAVIDTIAYSYKDRGLKFVFISDPIPELVIVVRKGASQALIDSVKKSLLSLVPKDSIHREDWGEDIRNGFVGANDSDFDGIRKMIEYLKRKGVYLRDDKD